MNYFRTAGVALLSLALAVPLAADVLVLKSGRRIYAWDVQQRGERFYYETPEGELSIPKRLVERVERDDAAPDWSGTGTAAAVAELPDTGLPALSDNDVLGVVENGQVNRDLLRQLEQEAQAHDSEATRMRAAAAHVLVAKLQERQSQHEAAGDSLRRALSFLPNHPGLLLNLAAVEIEQQRYTAALDRLRLVEKDPQYSFDAYRLQGWIYYQREEIERALASWKKALQQRSDSELEALVQRVEREARAVERYKDVGSGRFLLRYEGSEVASPRLAASILDTLDSMHDSLANTFNVSPREPFVVLLYPNQTFYDLTGMPPWVHGLFDGKIRVPIQGLVSVTPRLEQVLRHELVHGFVFLKSRNQAPRWLQEGLAQYHADQRPRVGLQSFRPLFEPRDGSAVPRIEASFEGNPDQVMAAYAAAWIVVDALERRFGSGAMERFVAALGRGESPAQALRTAYRLTPEDLDRLVYDSLR